MLREKEMGKVVFCGAEGEKRSARTDEREADFQLEGCCERDVDLVLARTMRLEQHLSLSSSAASERVHSEQICDLLGLFYTSGSDTPGKNDSLTISHPCCC